MPAPGPSPANSVETQSLTGSAENLGMYVALVNRCMPWFGFTKPQLAGVHLETERYGAFLKGVLVAGLSISNPGTDFCSMRLMVEPEHAGQGLHAALMTHAREEGSLASVRAVFEYNPFEVDEGFLQSVQSLGLTREPDSPNDLVAWRLALTPGHATIAEEEDIAVWDASSAAGSDLEDLRASKRWWAGSTMSGSDFNSWDETVGSVPDETILVARDEDGRIGAATFAHPMAGTRTLQSMWLMVRPDLRGRGLATALKRQQARHAALAGYDLLVSLTPGAKEHAQGAWRRLGAESRRVPFFTRPPEPAEVTPA